MARIVLPDDGPGKDEGPGKKDGVSRERAEHPRKWWKLFRRWATPAIRLLLVAAVVEFALLPQIAGARKSLNLLAGISPLWVVVGLVLVFLSLATYARLTQVTLDAPDVPFRDLLRVDLATLAVSHVVPAGSAVGVGLGYRLLRQLGIPPATAVSGKTLQTVGSAIVLNLILAGGLIGALALHGNDPLYLPIAAAGLALVLVTGTIAILLVRQEERITNWLVRVARHIPRVRPDGVARLLASLASTLRRLSADPVFLRRSVGWATANWLLEAGALWAFVRAFGHSLGPVGLIVAHGLASVAAALPITPGGLGIVEGVLVPVLVAFGTPRGIAVLGVVAFRLATFWLPIPIGFASYGRLLYDFRHSGSRQAAAAPPDDPAA